MNRAKFEIIPANDSSNIQQKTSDFLSGNCLETQGEFYASRSFQGYDESQAHYGKGEYEIFKGGAVLDSLVVVVDGFDPAEGTEDGKGIEEIYLDFNQQKLAEVLREGYGMDIVPLNFKKQIYFYQGNFLYPRVINGGTDYIERNAMVLVTLLEKLNSCKIGNEPIKVVGFSMGGLIARYALAYMEQENIQHNVDLFISIDSPHQGAVLPKGLQDHADLVDDLTLGLINNPVSMLQSPAAKQLLKHHIGSNSVSPQGAPNFHDRFFNKINQMGYPQISRNISVINGALDGSPINVFGEQYADLSANIALLGNLKAKTKLNYSPEPGNAINDLYFKLYYKFLFFDFTIYKRERLVSSLSTLGSLENSPGGYFPVDQIMGGFYEGEVYGAFGDTSPSVLEKFLQDVVGDINVSLNNPNFSFVPSKSSLDFIGDPYLYEKINNRDLTCSGETPFDSYYAPSFSQPHIYLSYGASDYIKKEMLGEEQEPNLNLDVSEEMNGQEVVCGTSAVYSFPQCGESVASWTVSNNLHIVNQTDTNITVKANNPEFGNIGYVQAEFNDGTIIKKDVYVGQPSFNVTLLPNNYYTTARAEITGKYADINFQQITSASIEEISGYGDVDLRLIRYNDKYIAVANGPSNIHWRVRVKFTGTNSCGSSFIYFDLEPPPLEPIEPCEYQYTFESTDTNVYQLIIPPDDPCDGPLSPTTSLNTTSTATINSEPSLGNKVVTISVYNFSGVLLLETDDYMVDLNQFKDGIYILKAEIGGKTYTKKVIKD